ncbi:unnamed protein product, partial [Rotaria sordida]
MKRKIPFISSVKNKCNSGSIHHIDENSSDNQSSEQIGENFINEQSSPKKVEGKKSTGNNITQKQFISAVSELGFSQRQLNNETWRLNELTRSNESVWGRLISKLNLNQTESIRHSMYNFWRRNRTKIESTLSENRLDCVKEDHKSDKKNEEELSPLNSEIKPLASNATLPKPQTRSTAQHKLNLPTIVEASFIMNYKDWKGIYDRSQRKMKSGWTDVVDKRVRSCNFHCTLAFDRRKVGVENSRKKNCSFFRAFAICSNNSCERVFDIFVKDEPVSRESIVFRVRAMGDENHEGPPVARQLTGEKRLEVGKAANAVGPLKVFHEKVESADEEMLKARNFTGCETAEVIKHASADYRKIYRLDEDIFRECRIRQYILEEIDVTSEEIKGYVQVTAEKPFRLHLTSEPQILRYHKTNDALNDISNVKLLQSSPDSSSSKCVNSFTKEHPPNDESHLRNEQEIPISDSTISPVNIFSCVKFDNFSDALSTSEQAKNVLKAENIEKENSKSQHEKKKHYIKKGISLKDLSFPLIFTHILCILETEENMHLRLSGLPEASDTCNSLLVPRLRQIVEIQQCPLTWPTFGIKKTKFEAYDELNKLSNGLINIISMNTSDMNITDKCHRLYKFINEFNNHFYLHRHDDIGCELITVYNIFKFLNRNNSNSFELNTLCNHLQSL